MTHLFRLKRKCRTIARKNLPAVTKKKKKNHTQVTARQTSTHISSAFSLSGRSLETTASGRGHKRRWMLPAAAANSCLLCLLCFTHLAPARLPGARCNDIQNRRGYLSGALRLGFDSPGGAAHCVGRGHGKKKHYTSPVFTEQFHPACNAWRIELGALSSLQMWQISTVAPFDTKCGTIIELVQP